MRSYPLVYPFSVQLDYHSSHTSHPSTGDCSETSFRIPIQVNDNPKTLHLLVDTGSPFTWILAPSCELLVIAEDGHPVRSSCQGTVASLSTASTLPNYRASFASGGLLGAPTQTSVSVGKVTIENLHILRILEETGQVFQRFGKFDGILGLARPTQAASLLPDLAPTKTSFIYNLFKQHKDRSSESPIFSLHFASSGSFIRFGGPAEHSNLHRFPLMGTECWILEASKVTWDKGEQVKVKVVLDSGTVGIGLSTELFERMKGETGFVLEMDEMVKGETVKVPIITKCGWVKLDLKGTTFEGAIVLGQAFFMDRHVSFGKDWVDFSLN